MMLLAWGDLGVLNVIACHNHSGDEEDELGLRFYLCIVLGEFGNAMIISLLELYVWTVRWAWSTCCDAALWDLVRISSFA